MSIRGKQAASRQQWRITVISTVVSTVVASSWAAVPRLVRRRERFGELVQPLEQDAEGEQQHEPDGDQGEDWDLERRGEQWGSRVGGEARW